MTDFEFPRITIVTPVFNQVHYLEQTVLSVIGQGYPNLEYIIIDGGSTDGTLDIIKKYENKISFWISEHDNGMYEALNKGFKVSTGHLMGWINSDDKLLPGSLDNIAKIFKDIPQINWIQGLNSFIDLDGNVINTHDPKKFSFVKFLNRDYKWIQQESTFWRRELWDEAGGALKDTLKLAGDFELWFRFFQFDKLYNTTVPVGAWRRREGQLSGTLMKEYLEEANGIIEAFEISESNQEKIRRIKKIERLISIAKKFKFLNYTYLEDKRNRLYSIDRVQIQYSYQLGKFIIQ